MAWNKETDLKHPAPSVRNKTAVSKSEINDILQNTWTN